MMREVMREAMREAVQMRRIDTPRPACGGLPAWALGLSLATHAALLAGPAWQASGAAHALPPLAVTLRPASSATSAFVAQSARRSPPAPVVNLAPLPRPPGRQAPPFPPTSFASPTSSAPPLAAAEPAPAPLAGPAETRETRALPAVAGTPAAGGDAPLQDGAPDADALAAYLHRLGELLAGQQTYPRLAAQRGWEGEVRLRLQIARQPGGARLTGVEVIRSSGFDVLDRHALQLLRSAELPEPPQVAGALTVEVPVHYRLKAQHS